MNRMDETTHSIEKTEGNIPHLFEELLKNEPKLISFFVPSNAAEQKTILLIRTISLMILILMQIEGKLLNKPTLSWRSPTLT
jgi:hypothetical protein